MRVATIAGAVEHDGRTGWCLAWAPSPPLLGTEPGIEVVAQGWRRLVTRCRRPSNLLLVAVVGPRELVDRVASRCSNLAPPGRAGAGGASSPTRLPSAAAASPP